MIKLLIAVFVLYVIVSLVIGIGDLFSLIDQDRYFASIPRGDLFLYKRKPILGKHNYVFFPSWIVIYPFLTGERDFLENDD